MTVDLWNAVRRGDFDVARRQLETRLSPGQEPTEHLLLVAADIASALGVSLGDILAPASCPKELVPLQDALVRYCQCRWCEVISVYNGAVGDEGETGASIADAFLVWLAIQSARAVGDAELARDMAKMACEKHRGCPVVLACCLQLESEGPYLPCPDLVLLDLWQATRTWGGDSYLQPAWPRIAVGIEAYMCDRDKDYDRAKKLLQPFRKKLYGFPLDLVWLSPFFHAISSEFVKTRLSTALPFSSYEYCQCHLDFGDLPAKRRAALISELKVRYEWHPSVQIESARSLSEDGKYAEALTIIDGLLDHAPRHCKALRLRIDLSIALNQPASIAVYAQRLMESSFSWKAAMKWILGRLHQVGLSNAAADVFSYWAGREDWQAERDSELDRDALKAFDAVERQAECVSLVNSIVEDVGVFAASGLFVAVEVFPLLMKHVSHSTDVSWRANLSLAAACMTRNDLVSAASVVAPLGTPKEASVEERQLLRTIREGAAELPHIDARSLEPDSLAQLMGIWANGPRDVFLVGIAIILLRMKEQGMLYHMKAFLAETLRQHPYPHVLEVAVDTYVDEMNDLSGALGLVEQYRELAQRSPDVLRTVCRLLRETDQTRAGLETAREGQRLFPEAGVFAIEEGIALVETGHVSEGLERLALGLAVNTVDAEGLRWFSETTQKVGDFQQLVAVCERACRDESDEDEHHDRLIAALDDVEGYERTLVRHLYHRVYRSPHDDPEKRKRMTARLEGLRTRLAGSDSTDNTALALHAEAYRARLLDAATAIAPLVHNTALGYVFTELSISDYGDEDEEIVRQVPGVTVVLDTRTYIKLERDSVSSLVTDVASQVGYDAAIETLEVDEIWNHLRRNDTAIVKRILEGVPLHHSPFIEILRAVVEHSKLVLDKFEEYVACYVLSGSFVRGTQRPDSDVDVWLVLNDSDVRQMGTAELTQKVRKECRGMASVVALKMGVARSLHVQAYLLSDLWQRLKESEPVLISLIRDGVPLYDKGVFNAWHRLLRKGELRATREGMMQRIQEARDSWRRSNERMKSFGTDVLEDIKHGIIGPLELLLQSQDIPIGDYRDVVRCAGDEFVRKRALLDAEILEVGERGIELVKTGERGLPIDTGDAVALLKKVGEFQTKCFVLLEQLRYEQDVRSLTQLAQRIDCVLVEPGEGASRARLQGAGILGKVSAFRDEVRQALTAAEPTPFIALRVSSLVDRGEEIRTYLEFAQVGGDA